MSSNPLTTENRTGTENDITGPHADFDHHGTHDHYFWRCENCGLKSTDASLRTGCFRCGAGESR